MKINKILLILFISISVISCGTRKTNQTKTDVTTKEVTTDNSVIETKTDNNTKTTTSTETNKESGEVTEVETIEPIDNTKPATYVDENGKILDVFVQCEGCGGESWTQAIRSEKTRNRTRSIKHKPV